MRPGCWQPATTNRPYVRPASTASPARRPARRRPTCSTSRPMCPRPSGCSNGSIEHACPATLVLATQPRQGDISLDLAGDALPDKRVQARTNDARALIDTAPRRYGRPSSPRTSCAWGGCTKRKQGHLNLAAERFETAGIQAGTLHDWRSAGRLSSVRRPPSRGFGQPIQCGGRRVGPHGRRGARERTRPPWPPTEATRTRRPASWRRSARPRRAERPEPVR